MMKVARVVTWAVEDGKAGSAEVGWAEMSFEMGVVARPIFTRVSQIVDVSCG